MPKEYIKNKLASNIDPTGAYPTGVVDGIFNYMPKLFGDSDVKVSDKVSTAAWRKRLDQPYNKKYLPENPDGTFKLPDWNEKQIEVDTTKIKDRIKDYKDYFGDISESDMRYRDEHAYNVMNKDKKYLNDLRRMYNDGDTISVNEYTASKVDSEITPLNVLQNFKLYKNKDKIMYEDVYDFNEFEKYIPGKPFKIKGVVK